MAVEKYGIAKKILASQCIRARASAILTKLFTSPRWRNLAAEPTLSTRNHMEFRGLKMFRTFRVPSTFVLIVRDDSNDFPRRPHGLSTSGAVKAELATEAAG